MSIYLDYSATCPVCETALTALTEAAQRTGNANSNHALGRDAEATITKAAEGILSLLNLEDWEVIFTSGATESNNLAIKGTFDLLSKRGNGHIITTEAEHPSVIAPISGLLERGGSMDFAPLDREGCVDLEKLKALIREDTLLVSVGAVHSELGTRQPIEEIGRLLKTKFSHVLLHVDGAQAVGKITIDYSDADLLTLSAHKFYGLKGVGALVKRKGVKLMPQNHGGRSTTPYRSGTPAGELAISMCAALSEAISQGTEREVRVSALNQALREKLSSIDRIAVNSSAHAIPHILNFSLLGCKAQDLQNYLNCYGVFLSVGTACSSGSGYSPTVFSLTGDRQRAQSSVRVSLSHLTRLEELDELVRLISVYGMS